MAFVICEIFFTVRRLRFIAFIEGIFSRSYFKCFFFLGKLLEKFPQAPFKNFLRKPLRDFLVKKIFEKNFFC